MNLLDNNASIRQAFGDTIFALAKNNKNIYVVSMDLKSALYLGKFADTFPDRFVECGVAENNAAGIAAGIAKTGKTVFLCSFACFSPGISWNTVKQSICYNNANVKIIGSHAGLLSTDLGATHQMMEDLSLMRSLPNMEVFSPLDTIETEKIISAVAVSSGPAYVRLVRANTPVMFNNKLAFTIGKSHVLKSGQDITILGHGPILFEAFAAQSPKGPSLEIINCSSIKPLDQSTILKSALKTGRVIVIEDHQKNGGLGEAVASLLLSENVNCRFIHLAVDNQFGRSAKSFVELYNYYGIGQKSLNLAIKKISAL